MEKLYYVISHKEGDIFKIQEELAAESGSSFVPHRACEPCDLMSESGTASIWSLTEEEAENLRLDSRIKIVGLAEDTEEDEDDGQGFIKERVIDTTYGNVNPLFGFNSDNSLADNPPTSADDWTVRGKAQPAAMQYMSSEDWVDVVNNEVHKKIDDKFSAVNKFSSSYLTFKDDITHYQADGEGIDIVIWDRAFGNAYNPDFDGKDGYRFNKVNWFEMAGYAPDSPEAQSQDLELFYADIENDHGAAVASAAAGTFSGWAKGAQIYQAKPYHSENKQGPDSRHLSLVLEWHKSKMQEGGNKRPTIICTANASQNYINEGHMPIRGVYRGQEWEYQGETRDELYFKYGLRLLENWRSAVGGSKGKEDNDGFVHTDYWLEECFKAGIPVIRSSGNKNVYQDLPADTINPIKDYVTVGEDYDNWVMVDDYRGTVEGKGYYYHRPSGPHFDGIIRSGEIGIERHYDENYSYYDEDGVNYGICEKLLYSSGHGPAVSLYAHTGNIYNSSTRTFTYDPDDNDKIPIGRRNWKTDWEDFDTYTFAPNPYDANWMRYAFYGTSAASPNVAGVLTCILGEEPDLTPTELHAKALAISKRQASSGILRNRRQGVNYPSNSHSRIYQRADNPEYYFPIVHNPYWKKQEVEIEGEVNLHSSTYLKESEVSANNALLLVTDVGSMLSHTTIQVENDQMTTENNETEVSVLVKDDNGNLIYTEGLVVDIQASEGTVGEVESLGSGLYKAPYFAPTVGSGSVTLKATIYGQEIEDTATVFYQGTDLQQPPTLTISSLNNAVETQENNAYYYSVVENTGAAKNFAGVSAASQYEPLIFTKTAGSSNLIALTQLGNEATLSFTPNPDAETHSSATATIRCTDSLGNSTEIDVVYQIIDVDDTGPVFSNGATVTTTSIDENTKQNEVVYTASATDESGGVVSYSLPDEGGLFADSYHSDSFSINAVTGEVTLEINPNYEVNQNLIFVVRATDGLGNISSQVVTLPINNVDELAPAFISSGNAGTIFDLEGQYTIVYTAEAVDTGDGSTGDVTYTLLDTYQGYHFGITSSTGEVSLLTPISYGLYPDNKPKFEVKATDAAGNFSTKVVTITISEDLDVTPPVITSTANPDGVVENTGAGQVVYTATATDDRSSVIWSLPNPSDTDFSIDPLTGEVTLIPDPIFNVTEEYRFTVEATDSAGNSDSRLVILPVINVDTAPPVFTQTTYTADALEEGVVVNFTEVLRVSAVDSNEATDGIVTFEHDNSHAVANGYSGKITVQPDGRIVINAQKEFLISDFGNEVSIKVIAKDASGNSSFAYVKIPLIEAGTQSLFTLVSDNYAAREPSQPEGFVEPDTSGGVDKYTYELLQGTDFPTPIAILLGGGDYYEEGSFTVSNQNFSNNELIFTEYSYNGQAGIQVFDNGVNVFEQSTMEFRVTYQNPEKNDPISVDIVINFHETDVYAPIVTVEVDPVGLSISEGYVSDAVLFKATADESVTWSFLGGRDYTDPNDGNVYTIIEPNEANATFDPTLKIHTQTGEVTWHQVNDNGYLQDGEATLTYTVVATDAEGNATNYLVQHTVDQTITGAYTGDIVPFIEGSYQHAFLALQFFDITENTPSGTELFTLRATTDTGLEIDQEASGITYSVLDNDALAIDSTTGVATLTRDYNDYENGLKTQQLTVVVNSPTKTASLSIILNTLDVNEAPFYFDLPANDTFDINPLGSGDIAIEDITQYINDPEGGDVYITVGTGGGAPAAFWAKDDNNNIISNYGHTNLGPIIYPVNVTATDAAGNSITKSIYINIVQGYADEKWITYGNSSGGWGTYRGYADDTTWYLQGIGSVSPNKAMDSQGGTNVVRLLHHSYYSAQISFKCAWNSQSQAQSFEQNWDRMVLTNLNGTQETCLRSTASWSDGSGYYWNTSTGSQYWAYISDDTNSGRQTQIVWIKD